MKKRFVLGNENEYKSEKILKLFTFTESRGNVHYKDHSDLRKS